MNIKLTLSRFCFSITALSTQTFAEPSIEHIKVVHKQAYRGDIPVKDLPQAISTFDKSLLSDLGITEFQDALDFSASIARTNNSGALWDSFAIRGFAGNENMPSGYLINGFSGGRGFSGPRDTSNVEFIEVLKGPGSALYGRSEPGGTINIVTKKPQFYAQGEMNLEIASFDYKRLSADYTNAITDKLAFRINGAWQDADSYRDEVTIEKNVLTPSLYYQIDSHSSLTYEFEYVDLAQLFDRGIVVLDHNMNTLQHDAYLGNPADKPTHIRALGHQFTYTKAFNQDWSLIAGLNYRNSKVNGFSSDAELSPSRQSLFDDGQTLTRQRRYRDYDAEDLSARFELSGHKTFHGLTHHLMFGLDIYEYDLSTALYRFRGQKAAYSIDIFNPGIQPEPPEVSLLYHNLENQIAYGVYAQDQIDINEQFKILLGLRFDQIEQKIDEIKSQVNTNNTEQQTSPRVGLVYKLDEDYTFYASYSEGFVPLSGTDYQGQAFGFEYSDSTELGAKINLGLIRINIAVFDANKDNILVADPVNVGFSAALGQANSQGLEIELDTYLTDSTQLKLSYAYTDAKTSKDTNNADWNTPIPKGSPLVNVPDNKLSLILNHNTRLFDKSFNIGGRFEYISERLGDAADLRFILPDYQLFNLYTNYQLNDQFNIAFNLNNILDEDYIESSYNALWAYPGAPRNFKVSLKYEF